MNNFFNRRLQTRKEEHRIKFSEFLADANFLSDFEIDYDPKTTLMQLSYRVDLRGRKIAFFIVTKKAYMLILDLTKIIRVEWVKNQEVIGQISTVDLDYGFRGTIRQFPTISSLYFHFYTNDPANPISKIGITFGKALPEERDEIRDIVYWFQKVHSSLQIIMPKHGGNINSIQK